MRFSVSFTWIRERVGCVRARYALPVNSAFRSVVLATALGGYFANMVQAQELPTPSVPTPSMPSAPVMPRYTAPAEPYSYSRKEQTRLNFKITAAADVNPDEKSRAAPILVRVYELRSGSVFESADYFSLQNSDKTVLGADLLARDEFIMRPGDSKTIRRKSHPDIGAVGILAGYRDLARSEWRVVQQVEPAPEAAWYRFFLPSNKSELKIQLQTHGVRITPLD